MNTNIGSTDRMLRGAAGVVLALLALFVLASPWSWLAGAVAVVMLGTAATRVCPAYTLVGMRTDGKPGAG